MSIKDNVITIVLMLFVLSGSVYFGLEGKPAEMGLIIIAGSICMAFANIDKIQKFKGAGFEAEMKKAVDEAYATVNTVKQITKPLLLTVMDVLTYAGRWGGVNNHKKHRFKEQLNQLSIELEINDESVKDAMHKFYTMHAFDLIQAITSRLSKDNNNKVIIESLKPYLLNREQEPPSGQILRETLRPLGDNLGPDITEAVEDYEYYLKNKTLRRESTLEE